MRTIHLHMQMMGKISDDKCHIYHDIQMTDNNCHIYHLVSFKLLVVDKVM